MTQGFQQFVQTQPAPGEPGDFAGTQIYASQSAPANGWRAAASYPTPNGLQLAVIVGNFAWGIPTNGDPTLNGLLASYYQPGSIIGFVHRENQGLLVNFLQQDVLAVQDGYPCYAMARGEFWAKFNSGANRGDYIYADAVTGAPTANSSNSAAVVTTFTAAITAAGVLTVTSASANTLAAGQLITGTNIVAPTYIVSQLTGTTGGNGTYQLNQGISGGASGISATAYDRLLTAFRVSQTVPVDASVTATISGYVAEFEPGTFTGALTTGKALTITGTPTVPLAVGQVISGANVPAGTYLVSGSGTSWVTNQAPAANITAEAMTNAGSPGGLMTVTAVGAGTLTTGQFISWAAKPAGNNAAQIYAQLSGTAGGIGVYQTTYMNQPAVGSTTITATQGKVGKISTWQTN